MTWLLFAVFNIYQGFCRGTVKVILNLVSGNLQIDLGNEISTPWFQVIQLLCLGFKERQEKTHHFPASGCSKRAAFFL